MAQTIQGVRIKELMVHKDERGIFFEIIRNSDTFFRNKFKQLSFSVSLPGVAKAWHLHKKQTDWMCVVSGDIKLALYDTRRRSPTHKHLMEIMMGEKFGFKVVRVPPGVAHGYQVIHGPMHIVYCMNKEYDPKDELRIPHDDPEIGYNWKANFPIS